MSVTLEPATVPDLESIPVLPEEPDSRRDILLKAADLIEKHGWVKGRIGNERVGFCIIGAVGRAGGWWTAGSKYMYDQADKIIGYHCADYWNDKLPDGSGPIVSATLRKLAAGKTWEQATR